jgi:hypothetical protein
MKEHVEDRKALVRNIMEEDKLRRHGRMESKVNIVFMCAVVLPALWLFFVFLLSMEGM